MQKIIDALSALAGLMGAGGVAAAAVAAHIGGGARLANVAMILLVHAAAVLALSARAKETSGSSRLWLASALALAFGATLFSADVALLTLRGARLFPMAAPTGGMTMIAGWLLASAAGLAGFFRRYR
ncbi:DUF423 domain-containing protein [uncultured Rhodoblastus sp.]|uniref:DUF423 domain-containing protein n=1 Tax=uncultured Rhodoblastus sp. TaxID=543037 RepID=UPI0025E377CC|nr:DUF423 domain-containing protein [uncultured Rhodoblastus sp.]